MCLSILGIYIRGICLPLFFCLGAPACCGYVSEDEGKKVTRTHSHTCVACGGETKASLANG